MQKNQTYLNARREGLLVDIQDRLLRGERRALKPQDIPFLLEWIVESEDADQRAELLKLFHRLGGLDLVRAALSDYH
ncbi:hypothetical protein [Roseovarius sp. 2305UL8-3]|uniref:hypothetical protein n=1 Tax=Roseovarius conchicola TaxID=3121636 RepID=UPI003529832A